MARMRGLSMSWRGSWLRISTKYSCGRVSSAGIARTKKCPASCWMTDQGGVECENMAGRSS
eukprot:5200907-Amphidinium_carterae.1